MQTLNVSLQLTTETTSPSMPSTPLPYNHPKETLIRVAMNVEDIEGRRAHRLDAILGHQS